MPYKYQCDSCNRDITNVVRIKCAECDVDLCVTCFSSGAEIKKHKNNHAYKIIEVCDFSIYDEDWGADEELILIDLCEQYGLGNWEQISENLGSKTKKECANHYMDIYVNSPKWPYPPLQSLPANHEIAGYMPGRKEFETEYENDAEQTVKDMVFDEFTDTPEEYDLKIAVLDIYNSRLDKRMEKKNFIFDRNFLDFKRIQAVERKRPKDDKELLSKMRVFAKLQSPTDFNNFVEGLKNEIKLKQKIKELQHYRQNGISSLSEVAAFESHKSQKTYLIASPRISTPRITGRKASAPLDLKDADGVNLLSEAEYSLCCNLRLLPKPYLVIKEKILSEYARLGSLKKRQARELIKIDVNKTGKIYDFFLSAGLIKGPNTMVSSDYNR
ncbi:hypothetical protein BCR32DRAFT_262051 [Anaeromyces robustus]|uniref:Transcriptional adapter 2 n=1 Tax=Anaeromyces robustus TaxID=1754192 RepID=A0A1Y1VUF9_9FUNG|nr:hypothetical protein BCR32DRAFT_262051 [Anaeromyces robustus]|eukprot:ORX64646.1 hypothetical protein BCR32DRAFT_262051 [Anaeromyces robustus]